MAETDDDEFNLIEPSLIQQLKKILDQYPDDQQILKEIIQNGEDAAATKVKFLYDKNSYGTTSLYDEELAQFQGPALYAYNDATFTREDWKGIRLVSDSIKVEDPLKVGRFGLGFKSVFHLTDLPSILSDTRIGIIDPHGVYFSDRRHRRTGKHWQLKDVCKEMDKIPDQFLPYKGVFGCSDEVFSRGYYDGTLFRFPLRTKPSKLSETLYSAEKMDTLFESFKADAHMMLLFLQHVESIKLYVREESESDPRRIFQVKIAEKSLQAVRAKRKEFYEKIMPGKVMPASITVTYPITIETMNFNSPSAGIMKSEHSFFVSKYFCGGQVSSTFQTLMTDLMTDHDLSYIPAVSVAMALPTNPASQTPVIQGHVFCSLPLPRQKTILTGLPVHVNGFFSLGIHYNRHYIKQETQERSGRQLTDKSLLWNKCLIEEAIPRAYTMMLMEAINESAVNIPTSAIYKAWPDVSSVDQKWKGLEEPLFRLLLAEKVVHTQAQGGKWVTVKEAIFQRLMGDEPKHLLLRVLLSVKLPVVTVPSHMLNAIDIYAPNQAEITPCLVRRVLRQAPSCYTSLHRKDKLLLLRFSLRDGDFKDLGGLQLLPLANGQFAKFEHRTTPVYISSPEHPQELFPGLEDRFLDTNVHEDILQTLQTAASEGHMQLRFLTKEYVTALLWYSLPPEWKKGETVSWYPGATNQKHPPKEWIKLVWTYLREHFTTVEDIQSLGKLPLIPLSMSQTPVILTRLCCPSLVVVKCLNDTGCLDGTLTNVLAKKLGLIVVGDLPTFIRHHPAVVGTFVNPPSVPGVLNAMAVSSSKMTVGTFLDVVRREVSTKGKHVLRSFISNIQQLSPGTETYNFLCSLPIFETVNNTFVSKQECVFAAPAEPLPIPLLREAIDISHVDSKRLALLLHVKILTPTELLCKMVFPDIQQGNYNEEEIDKLMLYVLQHFAHAIRTDANFKRNLQMLPFVPKQKRRVRALDLFDPRNETLKQIFAKENVFPAGMLYYKRPVLEMLEDLGMKSESSITSTDLYQSAKLVQKVQHLPTARTKANAIFQYLADHPSKLQEPINGQPLGALLKDFNWVSRLQQKTSSVPPSLPWFETEEISHFFKPTELTSHQFANLIGTVKPIVEVDSSSQIAKYFGWHNKPNVLDVVKHLERVIGCYSKDEKPYYMVVVNEIYSFLSRADDAAVNQAFGCVEMSDWVWNGDGFSPPNHLLFSKPPIDLAPYMLCLSSEMTKHARLFYCFGMRERSDPAVLLQVQSMIRKKYEDGHLQFTSLEVEHDLHLTVDILNDVANKELSPDLHAKILVPVHIEDNSYIRLEPAEQCMYCEHEWLKIEQDGKAMEYYYVHPNVSNSTAERLGVPSLTNRMLDPNEVITYSKAVKGFFESLQDNPEDVSTLSKLHLPAMPPGRGSSSAHLNTVPITLHQSNELMFDDAPAYRYRIQRLDQPFVLDLSLMDVSFKSPMMNFKDLMMKLPSALQPKMLSFVVKEKLSNSESVRIVTSSAVDALKQQISSVQFGRGIVRHVNSHQKDFNEDAITNIERRLQSIELCAVESLNTSLFLNDNLIPESEAEVPYFQEKQEVSGEDSWKVFVNSVTGIDDTTSNISSSVSKVIIEMYGEMLGKESYVVSEMLRCPPGKIWPLLDGMGIREDDTYNPSETDIYPEPGSFIPIEDHHLLNDAFEEFAPGEYVGYQLEDPSLHLKEGVPTYIYAKIVEEVTDEDSIILNKIYRINIGDKDKQQVVVNAADLYKFYRLKQISDQQGERHRNRQQVFDKISSLLKDAWKLPEEKKRQVVKRLYLQWHPDKNSGDEEFCTDAFQHIHSEISQLDSAYMDFFVSWEVRAKEHGSQREEYRESFSQKYGTWGFSSDHTSWQNVPPSFCKRNSQPGEAARWLRQADADLAAATNDVNFDSPSCEWACFKCHQAAEKALKAAQYKVDANKVNVHNLVENCCGLDDSELIQFARQFEVLVGDSTHMRYPDRMCYPQIPNDVYSAEMATEALGIAKKVVERVRGRLTLATIPSRGKEDRVSITDVFH